jgi:hypothetical protein
MGGFSPSEIKKIWTGPKAFTASAKKMAMDSLKFGKPLMIP